ncbi:phosphatidylserine decarboxylase [Balamuthia mandrillaris]
MGRQTPFVWPNWGKSQFTPPKLLKRRWIPFGTKPPECMFSLFLLACLLALNIFLILFAVEYSLIPTSQLNYNLDIEVWDWDKVSSNDFAGTAVLDLSTLHPKQPVDVWLPIKREHKHKQKTYGEVHIKAQMYTKPEVEAMFWRGVMDHFDTNKSGSIGHLELIGLLDGIGSSLTDEEIETLFDEFDENKDGEISFDELLKLVTDESARSNDLVSKMLPVDEDFIWTITAQAHDGATIGSLVVNNNWNAEIEFRGSDGKKKKVSKIMVHDRATGKLVEEKIPHYIKVSMRVMYATGGGKRAVDMKRTQKILKSLTVKQGRKYNSPTSVRDIAPFIQYHQLNEDEMLDPVSSFTNFNEFFYRKLKPSARLIAAPNDPKVAVSPADCRLNAFPKITSATELWIKGKNFSLASLLQNNDLVDFPDSF